MPDSASILKIIDQFWDARLIDDKAAVQSLFSPEATYEMVGANAFADPATVGPSPAGSAGDRLVGRL